jgi:hypothetical protein
MSKNHKDDSNTGDRQVFEDQDALRELIGMQGKI